MAGHLFTHQSGAYHLNVTRDGRGRVMISVYIGHSGHAIVLPPDAVERLIAALSADQAAPALD